MAFNKKKDYTVPETLKAQSDSAIGIIHSLINSLVNINEKIADERKANEERIAKIQYDQDTLDSLCRDNDAVIANFKELLGAKSMTE